MQKKIAALGILLIGLVFITNCSIKKHREDFYQKRANHEITIVFKEITEVDKKKAVNLIFARYLPNAPSDSVLLEIMNQYTLYHLYELGYTNLLLIDNGDEIPETDGTIYEVELQNFVIKEFKYSETVLDSTSGVSESIKLKGIKTSVDALVSPIINGVKNTELAKTAKSSVEISETQEGQFAHSKTLKDILVKNKNGSTKYLSNVSKLTDGVFENECLQIAEIIAQEINYKIENIYIKAKKRLSK